MRVRSSTPPGFEEDIEFMERRIFTCDCGHQMRLNARRCGHCYHPTPFYNRISIWLGGAFILSASAASIAIMI